MKRNQSEYYRSAARLINLPGKQRRDFLGKLRSSIEEKGEMDREVYIRELGSPEEVSSAFYASVDARNISEVLRVRKLLVSATCITMALCVGIVLASRIIINNEIRDNMNGNFEDAPSIVVGKEMAE